MKILVVSYWFLMLCNNCSASDDFLSKLIDYLVEDLRVEKIHLIVDSSGKLSVKAVLIIERIIGNIPSIVLRGEVLILEQPQFQKTREVLAETRDRSILKILVVDVGDRAVTEELLMNYMDLFTYYPPHHMRSKCLIVIISREGSFETNNFFKFSWKLQFLDVTLIDVEDIEEASRGFPIRPQFKSWDAMVHQYNPFRNQSYKFPYIEDHKLFVNKVKNMFGYPLKVAFFEDVPLIMLKRNHSTNQFLTDDLYGVDAIVSRTLAEVMNFTLFVKLNNSGATPRILHNHLRNNSVDFVLNIMTTAGSTSLDTKNLNCSNSIFLHQQGHKIILKQEGYYDYNYFSYLLLVIIVSVVTATFSILMCLLPLNRESWSSYNIALLLLGITPPVKLRKSSERIFYISLVFISIAVSVELLNNLLSNMLVERKFRHYRNFLDIAEADMVIGIAKFVKALFTMNPALEKLFDRSMDINNFEGAIGCVENLLTGSKPVNGCDVNNVMADLVSKSYSNPRGEWTIGTMSELNSLGIEEAAMTWTMMVFAPLSVYLDECNLILRRLYEAGLITYWRNNDHAQWYFERSRSTYFKNQSFRFENPPDEMLVALEYKKVELNEQMIGVLILGWGISCLSFLFEIVWRTLKIKKIFVE